jgi:hypothetical protein
LAEVTALRRIYPRKQSSAKEESQHKLIRLLLDLRVLIFGERKRDCGRSGFDW